MNTNSSLKSADTDYLATQIAHNSPPKESSPWHTLGILGAAKFMDLIRPSLYDDDVIADFGARNGHVADWIRANHAMLVTCIELVPEFAEICENSGHVTLCEDIENLSLKDGSVDWGFCHHTLEHVRNLDKAASEISRVVKRGLFLVFPLEDDILAAKNPSHMNHSLDPDDFLKSFLSRGWKRGWWEGSNDIRQDYQVFLYK